MSDLRTRATDAGIELVGEQGLRALTHARVDERAGLPKGSTSNYFRTRAALVTGVVHRIAERDNAQVAPALRPATPAELVDALCGLLDYETGPNRVLTAARLTLFMEAGHTPAIREALSQGRAVMEAAATRTLRALGAADPDAAATAVMACAEGLLLHRIARHDDRDPRPALELVVRAALG